MRRVAIGFCVFRQTSGPLPGGETEKRRREEKLKRVRRRSGGRKRENQTEGWNGNGKRWRGKRRVSDARLLFSKLIRDGGLNPAREGDLTRVASPEMIVWRKWYWVPVIDICAGSLAKKRSKSKIFAIKTLLAERWKSIESDSEAMAWMKEERVGWWGNFSFFWRVWFPSVNRRVIMMVKYYVVIS